MSKKSDVILNIGIVNAISADNNLTNEERTKNIDLLKTIKGNLSKILKNDELKIDYYSKKCDEGITILEAEIKANS